MISLRLHFLIYKVGRIIDRSTLCLARAGYVYRKCYLLISFLKDEQNEGNDDEDLF